jgi:hypothetical protein
MLPLFERYYARHHTYRLTSAFAAERLRAVRAELERGATVYLAGIAGGGPHNSGVALVEASRERGTRLICNHEDSRALSTRPNTPAMHSTLLSKRPIVSVSDRTGLLHGSALGTTLRSAPH